MSEQIIAFSTNKLQSENYFSMIEHVIPSILFICIKPNNYFCGFETFLRLETESGIFQHWKKSKIIKNLSFLNINSLRDLTKFDKFYGFKKICMVLEKWKYKFK